MSLFPDRDKDTRLSFPRKSVHRSTLLALTLLILLSIYLLTFPNPFTLAPRPHVSVRPTLLAQVAVAAAAAAASANTTSSTPKPQISLNPVQELAAVTGFLASHYQNVIPHTVDPSLPIEPDLVLDFDTRGPRAIDELETLVSDVWIQNPVVLYAKFYNAATREIKNILSDMNLRPSPTFFSIDRRDDGAILAPLILRLTNSPDLPVLLINGKPVGSLQDIRTLNESGNLHLMVTDAGAVIDGGGKRKKGKN